MNQAIAITREQKVSVNKQNILIWVGQEDKPYVARLSKVFASANIRVHDGDPGALELVASSCKAKVFTKIITTRLDVLGKLLPAGRVKKANITNYTGSLIPFDGVEFLILPPLKQLVTVEYAEWMIKHLAGKLLYPDRWRETSEFQWWLVEKGSEFAAALNRLAHCDLIS